MEYKSVILMATIFATCFTTIFSYKCYECNVNPLEIDKWVNNTDCTNGVTDKLKTVECGTDKKVCIKYVINRMYSYPKRIRSSL